MLLWMAWWNAIGLLRPAFSRRRTFLWFATAVAGLTVRTELLGVTSIVRALKPHPRFYNKLLDHFHSRAVKLDRLSEQPVPLDDILIEGLRAWYPVCGYPKPDD
jgi:hypothetical protein